MKNLFVLLIFVPLFVSIKIPFTDWEWNWDFNWDFSQFIDNIKSGVPDFINNFKTEIQNFLKEDELGKRKWIKNLADKAKTEYDKIKNKTTEATEDLAKLAEFTTQELNICPIKFVMLLIWNHMKNVEIIKKKYFHN